MLTSKPRKKKRGRQPPKYGQAVCPFCATKLRLRQSETYGSLLFCPATGCGWLE